jgi:hypothetical protein
VRLVAVKWKGVWTGWRFFLAKMDKQGRTKISKLMLALMQGEKQSFEGSIVEITLEST